MSEIIALSAESIAKLDRGIMAACLNNALQRAVDDCVARPADDRARVVTLQIQLTPKVERNQTHVISCDGAAATYKVQTKCPPWEQSGLDFGVRKLAGKNVLTFNQDSPEDHRQMTFLGDEGEDQE